MTINNWEAPRINVVASQTRKPQVEKGEAVMEILNLIVSAYGTWLQWRRDRQERV